MKTISWSIIIIALLISGISLVAIRDEIKKNTHTPHQSISINSNNDFGPSGYNFPGEGTAQNPYVIENLAINTDSDYGIRISGTTVFFIIRYCVIESYGTGIDISNVFYANAKIESNNCFGNINNGIYLYNAHGTVVKDNICSNNGGDGIALINCDNSEIKDNRFSSNLLDGIRISDSDKVKIRNNKCLRNEDTGILVVNSDFLELHSNFLNENQWVSIYVVESNHISVENNECFNNINDIIAIVRSNYSTIKNNICSNGWGGVELYYSEMGIIEKNICRENNVGIYLESARGVDILGNVCEYNIWMGITTENSWDLGIFFNKLNYNGEGGVSLRNCDYCLMTYNEMRNNILYGAEINTQSEGNSIHHNRFIDNYQATLATIQVYDHGSNNIWYDLSKNEGNWWSDWDGDSEYHILGAAGAIDPFPLEAPVSSNIQKYTYILGILCIIELVAFFILKRRIQYIIS